MKLPRRRQFLHLASGAAALWMMTGVDLVHVPYRGAQPALTTS
jgi:tripartite-type tricarboxylate transporter receptor subunit TctC